MIASPDDGRIVASRPAQGVAGIQIDRPAKRNAFTPGMLDALAEAYTKADRDPGVRIIFLHAAGVHFTGGLDLGRMTEAGRIGEPLFPAAGVDPVGLFGPRPAKPVVVAIEGMCLTLGVELTLAADVAVCSSTARFAQVEVQRSIMAYAGATIRMVERFGWGNAMRYLLTGDQFGADEALRLGLVQEVVEPGEAFEAGLALARSIAAAAPLAVQATIANAALAVRSGQQAAIADLLPRARFLAGTEDAVEGVAAFRDKRPPKFSGR